MRALIIVILYCGYLVSIEGQISFVGKVINNETRQPISGIEIFDDQTKQLAVSDENGEINFESLDIGQHLFTLFGIEYKTKTQIVDISESMIYTFELEKLNVNLSAIDIVARRAELFEIKQLNDIEGTSIFAGKKSEVVVLDLVKGNLASNNGRQVYAQVSGLNIYEGSDGGLQLNLGGRGLDPNRTSNFNTRQNGYDISADVLGYPENYYTPPTESLSEIRIVRGASSLQYGTQFGGLIDFRTRKIPSFKKIEVVSNQTVGSFGLFNSFNYLGVNKGRLSLNTFFNFKQGDGYRNNSEFNSKNLFIDLGYKVSEKLSLSFEYTYFNYLAKQAGGLTDQQFLGTPRLSTRDRNWFGVNWNLFSALVTYDFSTATNMTLNLFALDASRKAVGYRGNPINLNQNPITDLDEQDGTGAYVNPRDLLIGDFKNVGAELRLLHQYNIGDREAVFLIGSKIYKSYNQAFQGPGSLGTDADFSLRTSEFSDYPSQSDFSFPNFNLAIFTENIFYLSDKLSLIPGVRVEHIETSAKGNYSQVVFDNAGNAIANNRLAEDRELNRTFALLGLGVSYKSSDAFNFVANLSQNYRSVTFSDIRVVSPSFIVDPDISDERGFTTDIGIKGRIKNLFTYDLTLYAVLYDDRIGIILDDRANRVRKNIGTALIAGTESLLNFNLARMINNDTRDWKLNYFINTSFTHSEYIDSEEINVEGKSVEFIPNLNLKTGLSAGYKQLDASLQFTYLSSQFTDVQNSSIAGAGDSRSGIVGEIPAFHIMDVTLSYEFKNIGFQSGVTNLLDRNYFTRRATGYPGPGIIPSEGRAFYLTVTYKY